MARRPNGPRYFSSRQAYYVQYRGKQHLLAVGPEDDPNVRREAWTEFHKLMLIEPDDPSDKTALISLIDRYLDWVSKNQSPKTYAIRRRILQTLCPLYGTLPVKDLKRYHIEDWIDKMSKPRRVKSRYFREGSSIRAGWRNGGRRMAINAIQRCLNWAVDQGMITKNPVKGMKKPSVGSRSKESLISPEQHQAVMALAHKALRQVLFALKESGARPDEIIRVEAKHFYPDMGSLVLDGKTTHRTGKPMTVLLTDDLLRLVKELAAKNPTGPLFRTLRRNRPWTIANLDGQFRQLRMKAGLPATITPYSYRHTFATEWLRAGKPIAYLVQLLNNSIEMIQKHYGHLDGHQATLRNALLEFTRETRNGNASSLVPTVH